MQGTDPSRWVWAGSRRSDDGGVDSLGGYHLVRRLGVGSRSEVWLGSDGVGTVAIKVFREGVDRESIDAEIESLGRASGRHVVGLEDLAMGPHGVPCLILRRLSAWSLGRILGTCRPSVGESVTILAPLCLAVAELHRVGVAHGHIHGGSVLFDDEGAPVLASFGHARLFGPMPVEESRCSVPPAQLLDHGEVASDLDALTNLCTSTLPPHNDVARWLAMAGPRDSSTFARELAERLFQLAVAVPVQFATRTGGGAPEIVPLRVSGPPHDVQRAEPLETANDPAMARSSPADHVAALLHIPEGMVDTVFQWCNGLVHRAKQALRPVRKPVWIIAGLVTASVIVATAMMPSAGHGRSEMSNTPSPAPSMPSVVQSEPHTATTGDDPLAAASVLLAARDECFDAGSVLCLDTVDQLGSAAMEADTAQVRLVQEGAANSSSRVAAPVEQDGSGSPRHITVVERLGDSVLLSVTFGDAAAPSASFSLLLIKQEEGWRIRDFVPVTDSRY